MLATQVISHTLTRAQRLSAPSNWCRWSGHPSPRERMGFIGGALPFISFQSFPLTPIAMIWSFDCNQLPSRPYWMPPSSLGAQLSYWRGLCWIVHIDLNTQYSMFNVNIQHQQLPLSELGWQTDSSAGPRHRMWAQTSYFSWGTGTHT